MTARSNLPSPLKSPATTNSGSAKLPLRWLPNVDVRKVAQRTKQGRSESRIGFIVFFIVFFQLLKLDLANLEMGFNISICGNKIYVFKGSAD